MISFSTSFLKQTMTHKLSLIGSKEFIAGSLATLLIVSGVAYTGKRIMAAFSPAPTAQQLAAQDAEKQLAIKQANQPEHEAWMTADAQLAKDAACQQDAAKCGPFDQGTTPAQ
jgi:hypothetical protein